MKPLLRPAVILLAIPLLLSACVTQKKYLAAQNDLRKATELLHACNEQKALCQSDLSKCQSELGISHTQFGGKQDECTLLKDQLADCKSQRDKQLTQVGDLTVLSKGANENINKTL